MRIGIDGDEWLAEKILECREFERRDSFSELVDYLLCEDSCRTCFLGGCENSGKSTMMAQAMDLDIGRSAYIQIGLEDGLDRISESVTNFPKNIDRIFIEFVGRHYNSLHFLRFFSKIVKNSNKKVVVASRHSNIMSCSGHVSTDDMKIISLSNMTFSECHRVLKMSGFNDFIDYLTNISENCFMNYPDILTLSFEIRDFPNFFPDGRFSILDTIQSRGYFGSLFVIMDFIRDESRRFVAKILGNEKYRYGEETSKLFKHFLKHLAELKFGIEFDAKQIDACTKCLEMLEIVEPNFVIHEHGNEKFDSAEIVDSFNQSGTWKFISPRYRLKLFQFLPYEPEDGSTPPKDVSEFFNKYLNSLDIKLSATLLELVRKAVKRHVVEDIVISETASALDTEVSRFVASDGRNFMAVPKGGDVEIFAFLHERDDFRKNPFSGVGFGALSRFGKIRETGVVDMADAGRGDIDVTRWLLEIQEPKERTERFVAVP